jgi:hypothetical protein
MTVVPVPAILRALDDSSKRLCFRMLGMFLILCVSVLNLALGFTLAVCLGHGPAWAERFLPPAFRAR